MNRIIYILLITVLFQLLGIGYMKFINNKGSIVSKPPPKIEKKTPLEIDDCLDSELKVLINDSIKEIVEGSKKLPQSKEYTVWDKKTVEHIGQKVLKIVDDKNIENLAQQILKKSKINTITIVKEDSKKENIIAINNKTKKIGKKRNIKSIKNQKVVKVALNKIENLTQKILQESKTNTITIIKENSKKDKKKVPKNKKIVKVALNKTTVKEKIHKQIKKDIKQKKIISVTQKVEKYAKEQLGQKYVWGATGPNKFDCSGFTRYVFRSTAGIKIPRVSRDQAKVGKYIKNLKDLRRGDMVFFDTEKKFTGRVNHVGIYLSNGNFIHASSARKKVIITNFNKKPFYKRRFLWGRRVINVNS